MQLLLQPAPATSAHSIAPILRVESLQKRFTIHALGTVLTSLAGISFDLFPGRLTALVGPSGAGKSSVLKCIWRTYLPMGGRIQLSHQEEEHDLTQADEHTMLRLRGSALAFVTQFLHVLPRQSTLDVVAAPLLNQGIDAQSARVRAEDILDRLRLPHRLWSLPPATFSGGEKQRVNLARGLIQQCPVLLLDEPTASLDADSVQAAIDCIITARSQGAAILAIFHDKSLVSRLADQVVELQAVQTTAD